MFHVEHFYFLKFEITKVEILRSGHVRTKRPNYGNLNLIEKIYDKIQSEYEHNTVIKLLQKPHNTLIHNNLTI